MNAGKLIRAGIDTHAQMRERDVALRALAALEEAVAAASVVLEELDRLPEGALTGLVSATAQSRLGFALDALTA